MKNKIILICGDPHSINTEIIFKTWSRLNSFLRNNIYLVGNYKLISDQLIKLKKKVIIQEVKSIHDNVKSSKFKIIDIPLKFKNPYKISRLESSKYVLKSLDLAHKLALDKKVKGIINCPINKKLIASSKKRGVTEFFASKCKIKDNSEVMLIYNKNLAVAPLTTHIRVKKISKFIDKKIIIKKLNTINFFFKKYIKKKPIIGVLGLNPHNSEFEKSSEELTEILPAIKLLRKKGLNIKGPLVSDTAFINTYKKFNVIVGMYHDQVLTPFKTLYQYNAINITLGLRYIRVSPDHGPATDIIGKNKANYISLFQCIKFLKNLQL